METERDQFKIDPSSLTTQQLLREISSLKELMQAELERKEDAIDTAKEAVKIAHDDLVRVPTEVQKSVGTLKDLHEVKLNELEKLLNIHVGHITYIGELRSKYQAELDHKESLRIDAIKIDRSTKQDNGIRQKCHSSSRPCNS